MTDAKIAVIESNQKRHQKTIDKLENVLTEIQLYTRQNQTLLEAHETGISQIHIREIERDEKYDSNHANVQEQLHQIELNKIIQQNEDREAFKEIIASSIITLNTETDNKFATVIAGNEDREKRIRKIELLVVKVSLITGALATVASMVIPHLIKMFLAP